MNTSINSINEQLVEKKFAISSPSYMEYIRMANDAMSDLHGYKNQRIRQYIESQRSYTRQQPDRPSTFIERNSIDVGDEHSKQQQINNSTMNSNNIEPLPLPEDDG